MKKRIILMLGVVLLAGMAMAGCSSKSRQAGTPVEIAQLKEAVDSNNYKITVNMAYPSSGRSMQLTSMYSLKITDGQVDSHLPYFGRAYSLPYGGGEGLIFKGKAEKYTVSYGKGSNAEITFQVRTAEDTYRFDIQLYPGGDAYISVQPGNKRAIAYSGSLER